MLNRKRRNRYQIPSLTNEKHGAIYLQDIDNAEHLGSQHELEDDEEVEVEKGDAVGEA